VWPALRKIVRDRGIDIVHSHDYKTDLLALMLSKFERIVPLATAHGWTGHSRRERLLYYVLDKQILRAFPMTIAVSSEIREDLLRHGSAPERVRVILNGIDHRAFRRDPSLERKTRAQLGILPDEVVIGSIGRLEPQKRFDLLIEACAAARQQHRKLRLLIAGDGSLRDELKAIAAKLLPAPACQLLGHRTDVVALHHAFDVFVQASDYEGTPNSVLEAMALETPVVATAAGGTAELIADDRDGLIVALGDTAGLVRGIDRTITDKDATRERVWRARQRVETTLSFDQRLAAVERIYLELAARYTKRVKQSIAEEWA
jgi:glycosyltransferase involved in cell wall biosynthesis